MYYIHVEQIRSDGDSLKHLHVQADKFSYRSIGVSKKDVELPVKDVDNNILCKLKKEVLEYRVDPDNYDQIGTISHETFKFGENSSQFDFFAILVIKYVKDGVRKLIVARESRAWVMNDEGNTLDRINVRN